ncbi:MAG: hypothetical protein JNK68_13620, partial [Betaproteobacteria bacterium]|nr:hypothetical protein [Betaproteobacteria bacterium]
MFHHLTLAALATPLIVACAASPAVKVPEKLQPGANESLSMIVPAKGVQIYECR